MSKAVLISIRPKWCNLIAHGEKTVEVRKSRPKLEVPFRCYIYCTKAKKLFFHGGIGETLDDLYRLPSGEIKFGYSGELMLCNETYTKDNFLNGKIIGEFICDEITYLGNVATDPWENLAGSTHEHLKRTVTENACLTEEEMLAYRGRYGWHISALEIYDRPVSLGHFVVEGDCDCANCKQCVWLDPGNGYDIEDDCNLAYENILSNSPFKPLFRPPQSWCYVEEREKT